MIVRFHGTRGSLPVSGRDQVRYGGATPCIEVRCGDELLIIDAGTGLHTLGQSLPRGVPLDADLIFTHYHWDHVQGFPFFWPIYDRRTTLRVHGLQTKEVSPRNALSRHMARPVFPVSIGDLPARIYFDGVRPGRSFAVGAMDVHTAPNLHPGGCLGLRIEYAGRSFVHLTDTEHPAGGGFHEPALALARDADVVTFDTTFTEDEYHGRVDGVPKVGWGHATFEHGLEFGAACGARRFVLFHHAPEHDDDFLDDLARRARAQLHTSRMAVDGLEVHLEDHSRRPARFVYPPGGRPRLRPAR